MIRKRWRSLRWTFCLRLNKKATVKICVWLWRLLLFHIGLRVAFWKICFMFLKKSRATFLKDSSHFPWSSHFQFTGRQPITFMKPLGLPFESNFLQTILNDLNNCRIGQLTRWAIVLSPELLSNDY